MNANRIMALEWEHINTNLFTSQRMNSFDGKNYFLIR